MIEYILTFAVAVSGIVLGSVINYFVLKKLFRGQVTQIFDIFEGTKTGTELADMIHRANEFSKGEDAKEILGKVSETISKINKFIDSEESKELYSKIIRALDDLIGDE